ncbi:MAG: DNA damage-inducible protein D [Lachnospiraceae bacterium]|nr:DNA damage-inducible protein D [Lachnospiraceae bacterium]
MFIFFEDEYINTHGGSVPSVIDGQDITEETKNNYTESLFDSIRHINEYGEEYWYARELSKVLEYKDFRNFELTIFKAMEACSNSGFEITDHFGEVTEMVTIGSGAQRGFNSYTLDRYACYLIVMNGDPRKNVIALGQTYFAVKTRQQELIDNYDQLTEDRKRLAIRREMKEHNKSLAEAAKNAGIIEPKDYAIFQNRGYQGLYNGLGAKDIHARKNLKPSQNILDHMGSTELAANLFRATQADEKLRRDNVTGKVEAGNVHYAVGKEVRNTIKRLGGTMPEDLPTPDKSIKQIEREERKRLSENK